MAGIFVSYRRTDSDHAVLLYAWLKERFGREQVFWDREDIAPGQAFADVLRARVGAATALVALIGRDWISVTDPAGHRRLDSPDDWVRTEIAIALEKKLLVVPVLGSGVSYLSAADLPGDLQPLAGLQALPMSDARFHGLLVETLEKAVPPAARIAPAADAGSARIAALLRRQVHRLQIRAVELIGERRVDRALDELHEGSTLLMALLELSPDDVLLDVQLGFFYKTLDQAFSAAGDARQAERYRELAQGVFQRVKNSPSSDKDVAETASALNGLGNLAYQRGEMSEAIAFSRQALELDDGYAYAWHDLFAAYDGLARQGQLDLAAMREALDRLKTTRTGHPGLGDDVIADFEARLAAWERSAPGRPTGTPARGTKPRRARPR